MKQILIQSGKTVIADVPVPLVGKGHVLVEVAYSLISTGTEISVLESSGKSLLKRSFGASSQLDKVLEYLKHQGVHKTVSKIRDRLQEAIPVGYSCSGVVIQVGEGVEGFQPGDKVACAGAGLANHAEIVLIPRNLVAKVPTNCSLKAAASATLGAIAMQGVRRADLSLGEFVAVIGLGLLGQLSVQLLKANGCQVIGIDLDPRRVGVALSLGADYAFIAEEVDITNEIFNVTGGYGVDATIIAASSKSSKTVQNAMEITRKKGKVVVVGDVGLGLKRSPFYEKEIDLLISCSYGPGRYDPIYEEKGVDYPYPYVRWTENRNMDEYLRLLSQKIVNFEALAEAEYSLEQAPQAYAILREDNPPIAVLIKYSLSHTQKKKNIGSQRLVYLQRPITDDDRINLALLGSGNFASNVILPNLERLSSLYNVRALVSRSGANAWNLGKKYRVNYVATDYSEVLADPDVDVVLIATRHDSHVELAIKAALAGKAIFLEKPMAINRTELEELVDVIYQTKVPFMVGFNRRFSVAAQRTKRILNQDQNPLMILYRVNAGYIPLDHWVQTEEGGGRIIGEACHMLDFFQFLVSPARVIEINKSSVLSNAEHISSSDNISANLLYDNGSVATLLYTALGSRELHKEYIEIYSQGKVIVIDDFRSLLTFGVEMKGWHSRTQDKGHMNELRLFADYVKGKIEAPIPLDDLVETTSLSFLLANSESIGKLSN